MEYIEITKPAEPGTGFHIEGYPDGLKVVALSDPRATRVAAMVLHLSDVSRRLSSDTGGWPGGTRAQRPVAVCSRELHD